MDEETGAEDVEDETGVPLDDLELGVTVGDSPDELGVCELGVGDGAELGAEEGVLEGGALG